MIERKEYLEELLRFRDKQLIKAVTGIRRCGKPTLLELYQEQLVQDGVAPEQIIAYNLKAGELRSDEVQRVADFQKAVNALFIKKNCDVYITGSNAWGVR